MKQQLAKDIANTILHFRETKKCFLSVEEMKEAIASEVLIRAKENKQEVALLAQKEIERVGQWYDEVIEYDY